MTTTLLCTVPMILGLVFIYKKVDKRFENIVKGALKKNDMEKEKSETSECDYFETVWQSIELQWELNAEMDKIAKKEAELQSYLEYRFRAESDDYAMNNKIEQVRKEYNK